ncbi:MAG: YciI family protein [Rhizobiaceae bacterium]|nr:MAG: YciI family protein [Rhizobiaceae bacterium]
MHYAILCYNEEDVVQAWSAEEDAATMVRLQAVETRLTSEGKLGPVARLQPTTAARTLRKSGKDQLLLDGPFAETKEQFLGFFVVEVETMDEAIAAARDLAEANPGTGAYEIRPLMIYSPDKRAG